jgi:pimeloyl-ACP methyl ester carboxylesterase
VLASVKVPVLILVGEEDGVTPPEAAETMKALAPHAQLHRLPATGHLSSLESPGGFNAYVREFVEGN